MNYSDSDSETIEFIQPRNQIGEEQNENADSQADIIDIIDDFHNEPQTQNIQNQNAIQAQQ